ncbi:divergent polysaccharide deacetylase family protein [Consotaella salsifontis]|uniref:Divergent polysaccharide deacetylase n=1 Tax=Consotaella salsifontis TaxID=1365950 RepID=A0A1T4RWZ3_9HYPH|nr:divergent polysaccharide deacetylase family protein [Consotaella salsifontis]SKA20483.1 hypothetical protein SAMN05428963_10844 [Consotaella salsifontis]
MPIDLYRPLGLEEPQPPRPPRRFTARGVGVAVLFVMLAAGSAATALLQPERREARYDPTAASATPVAVEREAMPSLPSTPVPTIQRGPEDIGTPAVGAAPLVVSEPGSLRQAPQQAHIPDDALIESSPFGPLPVRGPDGRRPLDVYAGAPAQNLGTRIAIVVGGLGISQTGSQYAINRLPAGVTLAFASAGNSLSRWMQDARREGHELILQVPMEPFGYPNVTPGEHTVTVDDVNAGQMDDLDWSLGRMTNYVGIMPFMGARVTSDEAATKALLDETARRGLLFFDDGASARSLAQETAVNEQAPFARADIQIDQSRTAADLQSQLDALERTARAKGSAIGIASAFRESVDAIASWIDEARERGVEVVPVSDLALDPERR